jgi:hypothetical protein
MTVGANTIQIPKYAFSEPRRNLPGQTGADTAEDYFTLAFAQAYHDRQTQVHRSSKKTEFRFAREIPVNGYGIADLVWVAWANTGIRSFADASSFITQARPTMRAFELKLYNWRKAMTQAARYRYFAHQAIVILPFHICKNALPYIETFKRIKVGLWGYQPENTSITPFFTPRPQRPLSTRHYQQTVQKIASTSTPSLPIA